MGRGLGIEPSGRGMVGHAGAVLLHRAADRVGWSAGCPGRLRRAVGRRCAPEGARFRARARFERGVLVEREQRTAA
jgi:hypothetical protein